MSSLNAFLNPTKVENKEVVVSNRFLEKDEVVPFKIRPITQEENTVLIKKFNKKNKKGVEVFDRTGYIQELTSSAVVFPDLNNAELQSAYGVLGASKLLQKMLFVGEYAVLAQEVQNLSGLDEDINEDIEEVKN